MNEPPLYSTRTILESHRHGANIMSAEDQPETGKSSIWDADGGTTVPKDIREHAGLGKGSSLKWVSNPDEDFVRVYKQEEN